MRRVTAIAALPVVALALVGLSCSSDKKATEDTTSTTSTTAATTTSTAAGITTTTKAGTPACTSSELQAELGPSDAGAGQVYAPLILRNTSTKTCTSTCHEGSAVWNNTAYFNGAIDEAAVYSGVLTPSQIAAHYAASAGVNHAPTAAFTATATNLAVTVDGSASADPDGPLAGYSWNFGDGATASTCTTPGERESPPGNLNFGWSQGALAFGLPTIQYRPGQAAVRRRRAERAVDRNE